MFDMFSRLISIISRVAQISAVQWPVSRKSRYLFGSGKLFYERDVYIKESNFDGFKSWAIKFLVDKTSPADTWAKNYANLLQILILKYSSGPEKLPGISRNGPLGSRSPKHHHRRVHRSRGRRRWGFDVFDFHLLWFVNRSRNRKIPQKKEFCSCYK